MSNSYGILGFSSNWASQYSPSIIPPEYFIPAIRMGFRLARKRVKRFVDTSMPVDQTNPIIRWRIPNASASVIDLRTAVVWITLNVSCTGGTAAPSNLIWNMFERVRLDQANNYIEDRRYFNFWETLQYWLQTFPEQQYTQGDALYGFDPLATRQVKGVGWKYALPMPFASLTRTVLPFFQQSGSGVIPVGMQDITFQWEIANPATWVETTVGATLPTFQVTSMEIEYDEIILDANLASFVGKWFTAAGVSPQIPFKTHWTNIQPLTQAVEQDILIDCKVQSIHSIIAIIRRSDTLLSTTTYNKLETFLGPAYTNLSTYQWEVNGTLWPDKVINTGGYLTTEAYVHYLMTHNMFHSRRINEQVTPIDFTAFQNDKFVMCFNGNPHPFNPNLMTPTSTALANNQIHIRMQFSAPPPANLQILTHVIHWKLWNYNSRGSNKMIVEV